ncbi:MAG: DUF1799 domain-containing protein [Kiritimatiellia bacterium]
MLGAPASVIEAAAPLPEEDCFPVWEENWPAIQLFLAVNTQWLFAGMGTVIGLNYQSVEFVLKLYKYKKRDEIFSDLQLIERGALGVFHEPKPAPKG